MKARHGIAVPGGKASAAFRPTDNGKPAHAEPMQPAAHFSGGKIKISVRPGTGPEVLGPVETCSTQPILTGEIEAIANSHPPLFRRIDHEQSAERPESLAAKACSRLLIDKDHSPAALDQLAGSNKARQSRSDDDDIRMTTHSIPPANSPEV